MNPLLSEHPKPLGKVLKRKMRAEARVLRGVTVEDVHQWESVEWLQAIADLLEEAAGEENP